LFFLRNSDEGEEKTVRFRVKWDGGVTTFETGWKVSEDKWDSSLQRCRSGKFHGKRRTPSSVVNRSLNRFEECVSEFFSSLDEPPSRERVRNVVKNVVLGERETISPEDGEFRETFERFVEESARKRLWTKATRAKFSTLYRHLTACDPYVTLDRLGEDGLERFVEYLREDADMRDSTVKKQLSFLKWFLRWAKSKGHAFPSDFELFTVKSKDAERRVVFLEWSELMRLYRADIPRSKNYLRTTRDVFCLCCFTSLRYSDVAKLRWADVTEDAIFVTTQKTRDSLTIELNGYARAILDRHRGKRYPGGLCLPVQSNQKMNKYVKELCHVCGIDAPVRITYYKGNRRIDETKPKYELIGTHTARRTFICNALMLGISPETVMKWTGHSDYRSMKPYISVSDAERKKAMELFDKKKDD
jgi:integrase